MFLGRRDADHSGMLTFDLALDSAAGCDAIYGDEIYRPDIILSAPRCARISTLTCC
jgi:hypothetical protein